MVFTHVATAVLPLFPTDDAGQLTVAPSPSFHCGDAAVRYVVKFCVVPDESERRQIWMPVLGSVTPEFVALIDGSFHVVIEPSKMPAIVSGASFSVFTPLTL